MEDLMDIRTIGIELEGLADIMFDRFIDYSTEKRPPEQKLYLREDNAIVMPGENILAFLFGEDPAGCAKAFEGKRAKEYLRIGNSHVFVQEDLILFERDEKPMKFSGFGPEEVLYLKHASGRTKQGSRSIKQEIKARPVLRLPWALRFHVNLVKNQIIDETKLFNWFTMGGIQIALGTWRPRYGRFSVKVME
jgi:hypothetical protein